MVMTDNREEEIKMYLVTLAGTESRKDELEAQMQDEIDELYAPLREKEQLIREKYSDALSALSARSSALRNKVKQEVLEYGATVKHGRYQAVWNRGRVSWNTKGLVGYAAAHPEILQFRKQGRPSVSIRVIKGSKSNE